MKTSRHKIEVNHHCAPGRSRRLIVTIVTLLLANLQLGGLLVSASSIGATSVITPDITTATPLTGNLQVIDASLSDQVDPHVDANLAAYTTDDDRGNLKIRYFDFFTNTNAVIATAGLSFLPDVRDGRIVFTNVTAVGSQIGFFDTATNTLSTIPGGTQRTNATIGGSLIAFEDRSFSAILNEPEIVVYDLATGATIRLTNDSLMDQDPVVTPTGDAVIFQKSQTTGFGSDIYVAAQTSPGLFTTSPLTGPAGEETNADTDGSIVVYESLVGGEHNIAYRPITGGTETQIALLGHQRNPSVADGLISFESASTPGGNFDLFVYDTTNNTLHRVTETPVDESLNNITISGGQVRVVYSAPGANGDFDVFAFTFQLSGSPSGEIEDLIELVRSFDLPQGIVNSLVTKLLIALDALDEGDTATACDSLSAFINEVQAQSGKKIPEAQADQLINLANQVKQALDCQ